MKEVSWFVVAFPKLHGGASALDFVNTVDPRIGPAAEDFVTSPRALADWATYAGIVERVRVDPLGFRRALDVREALYRVFIAVAHGRRPAVRDLEHVHAAHAAAFARARLAGGAGGYGYRVPAAAGVHAILWPILESALEVLAAPDRLKECPGEECGWVFLDASRNGTRRWCSMGSCGTRSKMRRYRARVKRPRSADTVSA